MRPTKLAYVTTNKTGYMILYCDRFIILFTQINTLKKHKKIRKTFLTLQYRTLKSTIVQYNSWHRGHICIFESLKLEGLCEGDLV